MPRSDALTAPHISCQTFSEVFFIIQIQRKMFVAGSRQISLPNRNLLLIILESFQEWQNQHGVVQILQYIHEATQSYRAMTRQSSLSRLLLFCSQRDLWDKN